MALDLGDRVILESWIGPIAAGDVEDLEARIVHFGSPYGAALQVLLMRRAQMTVEAANRSAGDDRSDHAPNFPKIDQQIHGLVAALGSLESYTPSQAVTELMVQAVGGPSQATSTIDLIVSNDRPG